MGRKTKLQAKADELNLRFREDIQSAFMKKFSVEIVTEYNFFSGRLQSSRVDGGDFTSEQKLFTEAYESAYLKAILHVRESAV